MTHIYNYIRAKSKPPANRLQDLTGETKPRRIPIDNIPLNCPLQTNTDRC